MDFLFLIILPLNLCIGKNMNKFNLKKNNIQHTQNEANQFQTKVTVFSTPFLTVPFEWSSIFLYLLRTHIHHWWFEWWVDEICLLSCAWSSHYQETKVWWFSSFAAPAQAAGLVRFGNLVHFVTGFAISIFLLYSFPNHILFIR